MAKGEREACQLVLRADEVKNNLVWEMTPFKNKNGNVLESQVFKEAYIKVNMPGSVVHYTNKITPQYMPDALMPFEGGQFSLTDVNGNQPFYIQVTSTPDTSPVNTRLL